MTGGLSAKAFEKACVTGGYLEHREPRNVVQTVDRLGLVARQDQGRLAVFAQVVRKYCAVHVSGTQLDAVRVEADRGELAGQCEFPDFAA